MNGEQITAYFNDSQSQAHVLHIVDNELLYDMSFGQLLDASSGTRQHDVAMRPELVDLLS
jgi:hypothetical protein